MIATDWRDRTLPAVRREPEETGGVFFGSLPSQTTPSMSLDDAKPDFGTGTPTCAAACLPKLGLIGWPGHRQIIHVLTGPTGGAGVRNHAVGEVGVVHLAVVIELHQVLVGPALAEAVFIAWPIMRLRITSTSVLTKLLGHPSRPPSCYG